MISPQDPSGPILLLSYLEKWLNNSLRTSSQLLAANTMMPLEEHFRATGTWLFRWRSFIPLFMVVGIAISLYDFQYFMGRFEYQEIWEVACLVVSFTGLAVRVFTVGHTPKYTSGRNTSEQIAAELNTTGMYSMLRHPLYLGNFLIWLGILMVVHNLWLTTTFCLAFFVYYERIMIAEEHFLREKFGASFLEWASQTPAFFPTFANRTPPNLPFSLATVLRREYTALFGIVGGFFLLQMLGDTLVQRQLTVHMAWLLFLIAGATAFLVLWCLKRWTHVLEVEGR